MALAVADNQLTPRFEWRARRSDGTADRGIMESASHAGVVRELIVAAAQNFSAVTVTGGIAAPVQPDTEIVIHHRHIFTETVISNVVFAPLIVPAIEIHASPLSGPGIHSFSLSQSYAHRQRSGTFSSGDTTVSTSSAAIVRTPPTTSSSNTPLTAASFALEWASSRRPCIADETTSHYSLSALPSTSLWSLNASPISTLPVSGNHGTPVNRVENSNSLLYDSSVAIAAPLIPDDDVDDGVNDTDLDLPPPLHLPPPHNPIFDHVTTSPPMAAVIPISSPELLASPSSIGGRSESNVLGAAISNTVKSSQELTSPLTVRLPPVLWSPTQSRHAQFPETFKRAVLLLLMASRHPVTTMLRHPASSAANNVHTNTNQRPLCGLLPAHIWMYIISFASRDWFVPQQSDVDMMINELIVERALRQQAEERLRHEILARKRAEDKRDFYEVFVVQFLLLSSALLSRVD